MDCKRALLTPGLNFALIPNLKAVSQAFLPLTEHSWLGKTEINSRNQTVQAGANQQLYSLEH